MFIATIGEIQLEITAFHIGVEQLAQIHNQDQLIIQIIARINLFPDFLGISIKCKSVKNHIQNSIPKIIHFQLVYDQLIKDIMISCNQGLSPIWYINTSKDRKSGISVDIQVQNFHSNAGYLDWLQKKNKRDVRYVNIIHIER